MKALSVRQPWASLIGSGKKTLEIRSRPMRHRGPLLICAGSAMPHVEELGHPDQNLPRGVAICVVDVVDCRAMTPDDAAAAYIDFRPGHFAIVLVNPRPVRATPIKGQLGLFTVPDDLIQAA